MFYRCELILNGTSYDVTDDLTNWDELELAYKRSGFTGLVRSFTSSFEFGGATYNLIRQNVLTNGIDNSAMIVIYTQNNSWTWNELFRSRLDVSSMQMTDSRVTFACIDETITAKLNAHKSTKYEILVSSMPTERMRFDRMLMNNYEEYVLATEHVTTNETGEECVRFKSGWNTVPLYYTKNSVPVPGSLEFIDEQWDVYEPSNKSENRITDIPAVQSFICRSVGQSDVRIRFRLTFDIPQNYSPLGFGLYIFNNKGKWVNTIEEVITRRTETSITLDVDREIRLSAGQRIVCMACVDYAASGESSNVTYLFSSPEKYKYYAEHSVGNFTFRADWEDIGRSVQFDSVKPQVLLQSLVDNIVGTGNVTAYIDETPERVGRCMLVAAESIRDFANAKFTTSFADFCNFMEAMFGYVYTVTDNVLRFVHRDQLFGAAEGKEIGELNDFSMSVNASILYSAVAIGNNRVDYDEDNGLFELNFRQEFSTGRSFTDNTLTLNPVYRVDAYGVEYLVEKRTEETKDNESDKDVFAIYTNPTLPVTPYVYDIVTNGTRQLRGYFNTMFHPRHCIEANKNYLSAFADRLSYASSEGNTEYTSNSLGNLTDDIVFSGEKKYSPFVASFSTSATDMPDSLNGLISVPFGGHTYMGWVSQIKMRCAKTREVTYELALAAQSK